MEEVIAIAIGVLAASGVWLILRPRTFQVVMGLCLLSYGVNLFIFSMGSLFIGKEPIIKDGVPQDLLHYTDPLPQALVLTAIVISFAMTALFLVVLLASRGLTGTDHVDGRGAQGMTWMNQLIVAPILLPLLTAALMLMLGEKHRPLKARINLFSSMIGLGIAILLLYWTQKGGPGSIGVYLPGNWQVPFGIVLVVDQLSALMLVLTGIIGVSALLFAMARWDRAGTSFHALFQIQMMGLYGAFLTADLFNLFVFFEVLLAASYGLMLHGSGRARVSSGLHYIAINLLASSLFLIGAAMIYGVTGTLNFADLALKIPLVPEADRGLLHAGAAILATAFLAKAGMWPLNFWLAPPTPRPARRWRRCLRS